MTSRTDRPDVLSQAGLIRRTVSAGVLLGLLAMVPGVPAAASCVPPETLLANDRGSAIAFVGSAIGVRGDVVTMSVARPILGDLGGRIRIDVSHLPQRDRPREDAWSVVLLVDSPRGADGVHRPANECTLAIARQGTWAATQLLQVVTAPVLPPTDAGAGHAAGMPVSAVVLAIAGVLGLALGRRAVRRTDASRT